MATKLDLADAQFVGFSHGKKYSNNIIMLVESMGLTKSEWIKWKSNYTTTYLTDDEIKEIDDCFENNKI